MQYYSVAFVSVLCLADCDSTGVRHTHDGRQVVDVAKVPSSSAKSSGAIKKIPTGIDAAKHVLDSIVAEIRMHRALLQPGWKTHATPVSGPIGCDDVGASCKWLVYVGDEPQVGPGRLWNYFVVSAKTGSIEVRTNDGDVPLAEWKKAFALSPY